MADNIAGNPWFLLGYLWVLIPVVAIIGGIVYAIFASKYRAQEKNATRSGSAELRGILEQNAVTNQKLLEKLEGMDARLASVEKTLNDIP